MENFRCKRTVFAGWVLTALLTLAFSGCAWFSDNAKSEDGVDHGASPKYYDFGDILIPQELDVEKDESFIVKTPSFSAGVLMLKGRVERNSLISFFEGNMLKDNWQMVSSFKSPRTMMLFRKENRWCIINITDRNLKYHTTVEIWVAPHSDGMRPLGLEASSITD
jgi:hypothetical protein